MKNLREYIEEAEKNGVAIGHFNISNLEGLHAIQNAVKKLGLPAIVGLSEGEEKFVGRDEVAVLVKMMREKEGLPIFLNADHHYSLEGVKDSIDAGFDAVIFDGAKLPFDENIKITKECVDYAKRKNPDLLVEGELGYIGTGSNIKDALPEGFGRESMTKPEEARAFVEKTGVDLFAPSVGNVHGIIKGGNPKLDIERIKEIKKICRAPLVLHGGSGISDEDFRNAIKVGISVIHINTEIRVAYREALEKSLQENPSEIAPYKLLAPAVRLMEETIESRLKLFNNLN